MLAAGRPDSAVGWLLVCRELGLLASEIGRVQCSRGELQRAHEIETDLDREPEDIGTRIEAIPHPPPSTLAQPARCRHVTAVTHAQLDRTPDLAGSGRRPRPLNVGC